MLLKHIKGRSDIGMLKIFKEETVIALEERKKVNENLVYSYITDPQEQEQEEEYRNRI